MSTPFPQPDMNISSPMSQGSHATSMLPESQNPIQTPNQKTKRKQEYPPFEFSPFTDFDESDSKSADLGFPIYSTAWLDDGTVLLGGGGGRAGTGVPSALIAARLVDRMTTPDVALQDQGDFTPWDPYRIERLPPGNPSLQMTAEVNTDNAAVFGIASVKFHPYSMAGSTGSSLVAAQSAFAAALRSPNPAEQKQKTTYLAFGRSPFALASRAVALSVNNYTIIMVVRGTGPICQSTLPPFSGENAKLPGATIGLGADHPSSSPSSTSKQSNIEDNKNVGAQPSLVQAKPLLSPPPIRSPFATPKRKSTASRTNPMSFQTPKVLTSASHPPQENAGAIPSTPLKPTVGAVSIGGSYGSIHQLLSSPGGSVFTAGSAGVAERAQLIPIMRFRTDFAQVSATAQNAMIWTSDGTRLITAGYDGTIRAFLVDDAEVFASTLTNNSGGLENSYDTETKGGELDVLTNKQGPHRCFGTEQHQVPTVSPICLVIGFCSSPVLTLTLTPNDEHVFSSTGEAKSAAAATAAKIPPLSIDGSASLLAWRVPTVEEIRKHGVRIPHRFEPNFVELVAADAASEEAAYQEQVARAEAEGKKKPRKIPKTLPLEKQRERMLTAYPFAFRGVDSVRPVLRVPAGSPDTRIMSSLFWTPLPPSRQSSLPPCSTGVFIGPKGLEPIATGPQKSQKSRVSALAALGGGSGDEIRQHEPIEAKNLSSKSSFEDEGIAPTNDAWHKRVDEDCLLTMEYNQKTNLSTMRFWCIKHELFEIARLNQTSAPSAINVKDGAQSRQEDGVYVVRPGPQAILHVEEQLGEGLASHFIVSPCRQFIGVATDRLILYTSPSAPRVRSHVLLQLGLGVSPKLAKLRPLTRITEGPPVFRSLPCSGLAFDPISRILMGVSPSKAVGFLHNLVTDVAARKIKKTGENEDGFGDDDEEDENLCVKILKLVFCCCIFRRIFCCSSKGNGSWLLFLVNLILVLSVIVILQSGGQSSGKSKLEVLFQNANISQFD